jgi:hypothetical protein
MAATEKFLRIQCGPISQALVGLPRAPRTQDGARLTVHPAVQTRTQESPTFPPALQTWRGERTITIEWRVRDGKCKKLDGGGSHDPL